MYEKVSDLDLYNDLLAIYFNEYNKLSDAKKKMKHKYDTTKLLFEVDNYDFWFENEESSDITRKSDKEGSSDTTIKRDEKLSADLSDIPPLEGDEEVKERKELKILTPNKLFTRLPVLLVKIKAGNNLKDEIKR